MIRTLPRLSLDAPEQDLDWSEIRAGFLSAAPGVAVVAMDPAVRRTRSGLWIAGPADEYDECDSGTVVAHGSDTGLHLRQRVLLNPEDGIAWSNLRAGDARLPRCRIVGRWYDTVAKRQRTMPLWESLLMVSEPMSSDWRPYGPNVLVRLHAMDTASGGILLPDIAQRRPQRCTIEAVGRDVPDQFGAGQVWYHAPSGVTLISPGTAVMHWRSLMCEVAE